MDLQPLFSNVWYVFLIVVFFGGSIFVHELGHFLAARRRGVHVERFSIGFGPAIWSWRGKDGVEYRISWLPLGGYVALPQLADMSALEGGSHANLAKLPPPNYTTKLLVFSAGAFFNVLFAFVLASILWVVGVPESTELNTNQLGYILPKLTIDGKTVDSPAARAGLKVGDVVETIDGKTVRTWNDIRTYIALGGGIDETGRRMSVFKVKRGDTTQEIQVFPELAGPEKDRQVGIVPGAPLVVEVVKEGSDAQKIGLLKGDEIQGIDGTRILAPYGLKVALEASPRPQAIAVVRQGRVETLPIPQSEAKLVLQTFGIELLGTIVMTHPSPFTQLWEDAKVPFQTLQSLFNPHSDVGISKLSGFIGIIRVYHYAAEAGMRQIIGFTILINISLALFNLLPIPVLDGGHILFATIAKLRGKSLPVEFIATIQSVFMVLLFSLIIYVSVFDVRRLAREHAEKVEVQK